MLNPELHYKTKGGESVIAMIYRPRHQSYCEVDMFPWKVTIIDKSGKHFTNWYTDDGKWTSEQSTDLDLIEA